MKNTGIEYTSEERTPIVLPELAELLPPLGAEQFSALEADILQNGCYSPIITNEELQIVDGHHRFTICEEHGVPYRIVVFSFADLLEAKQWALDTQKGRRNLSAWEIGQIVLKMKPDLDARAKESQGTRTDLFQNSEKGQLKQNTTKALADMADISTDTMSRIIKIDEHAPTPVKEALDAGDLSINQGYNITRQVKDLPEDEQEEAAEQAIEMEKAKKELRRSDAEIDRKTRICKLFCSGFEKALLIDPEPDNVRAYVECTRMTPEEMQDTVKEARELAETFKQIAEIIETEILPNDWRGAKRALPAAEEANAAPTERKQNRSCESVLLQRSAGANEGEDESENEYEAEDSE